MIIKAENIKKEYTNIIKDLLNAGAYVDFANAKTVYMYELVRTNVILNDNLFVISIQSNTENLSNDDYLPCQVVKITVTKSTKENINGLTCNFGDRMSKGDVEKVKEYIYYSITEDYYNSNAFTTDKSEALRTAKVRQYKRRFKDNKWNGWNTVKIDKAQTLSIVKKYAERKNIRGYKNEKTENIIRVEKWQNHGYKIYFKGKACDGYDKIIYLK